MLKLKINNAKIKSKVKDPIKSVQKLGEKTIFKLDFIFIFSKPEPLAWLDLLLAFLIYFLVKIPDTQKRENAAWDLHLLQT